MIANLRHDDKEHDCERQKYLQLIGFPLQKKGKHVIKFDPDEDIFVYLKFLLRTNTCVKI